MTDIIVTREDLYDLIWTKPITQVAKDFAVSDVWISKACTKARIPRPNRGYWAKLQSGKKVTKEPLPASLLLQSDLVQIKQGSRYGSVKPRPTDEEIVAAPEPDPPKFDESIEDFTKRISDTVGVVRMTATLRDIHPAISRALEEDERRKEAQRNSRWHSGPNPEYDTPAGQRLILALNCLFNAWERLGGEVDVGGTRHLRFRLGMYSGWENFVFKVLEKFEAEATRKTTHKPVYGFSWTYESWQIYRQPTYRSYETLSGEVIKALIVEVIVRNEEARRASRKRWYEWDLSERRDAAKRIEKRNADEIERIRREKEELLALRTGKLNSAIKGARKAPQIRQLIAEVETRLSELGQQTADFDRWKVWASSYADSIDIGVWSIDNIQDWLKEFAFTDNNSD